MPSTLSAENFPVKRSQQEKRTIWRKLINRQDEKMNKSLAPTQPLPLPPLGFSRGAIFAILNAGNAILTPVLESRISKAKLKIPMVRHPDGPIL